ncbi:class I SAM-dependent methyltransferase [Sulfobacillus harzensis]|uniref:Class I SAM-dependent methyltransferase n=1 Tax=Sulfobacillus harzensis TaxID=2729629 RepID=A0A7Y0L5G9_9FIRM|nr:class I SAM-dependent methyltransferase [Sulfobacillus harzensis]NMP23667.1 class I SAM-dependent methyltransferase [Sulfobacillus harzensis]
MAQHQVNAGGPDWVSLEYLFRAFPSSRVQRQAWRQACEAVDAALLARGHHGLPALIPGLVHARLATALLAAGYRSKRDLQERSFLCLGCHAGLEVRILRDFGASQALGIEIRPDVVAASLTAGLIAPGDVVVQDFWEYLKEMGHETFDTVIALAPQRLPMERLWALSQSRLVVGGLMVVVAQDTDVLSIPQATTIGPAMEGTMSWYRLQRER